MGRKLSDDEKALWNRVAKTATAREKPGHWFEGVENADPKQVEKPTLQPSRVFHPIPEFEVGSKAKLASEAASRMPVRRPLTMDQKTFGKMKSGKMRPEARIDLHGMTVDQAQGALTRFVMKAHGDGKRLVLVITGKGRDRDEGGPIPVRRGVLRQHLPQWCATPPLASVVLETAEAHMRHGGGGAFYLYLRRAGKT